MNEFVKDKRGVAGLVVTILAFILVISALALSLLLIHNFIQGSNETLQLLAAKANEKLNVQLVSYGTTVDPHIILIENVGKGPEVSEIVALLKRNSQTLNVENFTLSKPIKVPLAETVRVNVSEYFLVIVLIIRWCSGRLPGLF